MASIIAPPLPLLSISSRTQFCRYILPPGWSQALHDHRLGSAERRRSLAHTDCYSHTVTDCDAHTYRDALPNPIDLHESPGADAAPARPPSGAVAVLGCSNTVQHSQGYTDASTEDALMF